METSDASVVARGRVRQLADAALTREDRASLFRFMVMMRASEERALTLYKQGKVPGSFYDGRGQEAISRRRRLRARAARTGPASCTATSAPTSSGA